MDAFKLGFVDDFRSPECAVLALHLIMEKQNAGLKYGEILDFPGFIGLFSPKFLNGKSRYQMVIKLKNTVRDLRDSTVELPEDLEKVRLFFRNRKRVRRPPSSAENDIVAKAIAKAVAEIQDHEDRAFMGFWKNGERGEA